MRYDLTDTVLSVSEFNQLVSELLSPLQVVVEGEIAALNQSQGKWLFLDLKDEDSTVNVFSMVFRIKNLHSLQVGMKVRVHGSPRLHQKSGRFSLTATRITPVGEGSLKLAYQRLKRRLDKEGLFAVKRKRKLPRFPEKIGLLTAADSRAYTDFVKVLSDRMGGIEILFVPSLVQGEKAVESLLTGLERLNQTEAEVIVLIRGGGSLDDLAAFNDEDLVRAIFASSAPVMVGVGHEADETIADFVADQRAATPTEAAIKLVEDRRELEREVTANLKLCRQKLIESAMLSRGQLQQRLGLIESELSQMIEPVKQMLVKAEQIPELLLAQLSVQQTRLSGLIKLLSALDYRQTLRKGFSLTWDEKGRLIRSTSDVVSGKIVTTQLYQSEFRSVIE